MNCVTHFVKYKIIVFIVLYVSSVYYVAILVKTVLKIYLN